MPGAPSRERSFTSAAYSMYLDSPSQANQSEADSYGTSGASGR